MSATPSSPDDATAPLGDAGEIDGGTRSFSTFDAPATPRVGDQIGPYKLLELLGEGGFGVVYLAERREPMVQRVALKVIKPGMDSRAVVARFEQERQALAVMDHPNVARVLDGGVTPSGRPYFVMEHVKGEPITAYADRQRLTIKERLKLFIPVCEAVQHAHMKGIIHRDLKPSNILVAAGEGDGAPVVKVIDFGVAKAISQTLTEKTIFTERGQLIGTPEYMSPEQAEMGVVDIDTRTDVYSLGVVLYELLSGTLPFDAKTLRAAGYAEIQRMIREVDPPKPSTRLSTTDGDTGAGIARARQSEREKIAGELRRELEWIPMKALRKDRKRRYASAESLAGDVRRYLAGEALEAGPESAAYRVRKLVSRYRGPVAAVTAVMVALVVGLGSATWQWREASAARDAARESEKRADGLRTAAETAAERANGFATAIAASSALSSAQAGNYGQQPRDLKVLAALGETDRFDVRLAVAISDQSLRCVRLGDAAGHRHRQVSGPRLSRDGKVAFTGESRSIRVWDAETGELRRELLPENPGVSFEEFAPSSDGSVVAGGFEGGTIRLWDVESGKSRVDILGAQERIESLAFSPDGRVIASGGMDGTIRLWDTESGKALGGWLHGDSVFSLAFRPDGRVIASSGGDGTIRLWDAPTGREARTPLPADGANWHLAFSPDGRVIASGGADETIRLWDVQTGRPMGVPLSSGDWIESLAFSPDGRVIAIGVEDGSIQLWDVQSGRPLGGSRFGHEHPPSDLVFRHHGKELVSTATDGTVRIWDATQSGSALDRIYWPGGQREGGSQSCFAFHPNSLIVASSRDGRTVLFDLLTGKMLGTSMDGGERGLAFSPDGKSIAVFEYSSVRVWDTQSRQLLSTVELDVSRTMDSSRSIAFSPDAMSLAWATSGGVAQLVDVQTGRELRVFRSESPIKCLAFSPDGLILASGGSDGTVSLWEVRTGRSMCDPLRGHSGGVNWLTFDRDGSILASGGGDQSVRLWGVPSGRPIGEPVTQHGNPLSALAFSPDGRLIASTEEQSESRLSRSSGAVTLWDVSSMQVIGSPLRTHDPMEWIPQVGFSPDGCALASLGAFDGFISVWHAVPVRDRSSAIRTRLDQVDSIRTQLASQIASVGEAELEVAEFQQFVLEDQRFEGDLRTAALIVVGEVALDRDAKRQAMAQRVEPIRLEARSTRWESALTLLAAADPADLAVLTAEEWNQFAWFGLTELAADSPARDLNRLLGYAERAVTLSERKDGAILDTLARAHWELGDKAKSIEIQAEAVQAARAQFAAAPPGERRDALAELVGEASATLAKYEREVPPAPAQKSQTAP
jgi:WD40 repeat protein/serine/threonine protein kinase